MVSSKLALAQDVASHNFSRPQPATIYISVALEYHEVANLS